MQFSPIPVAFRVLIQRSEHDRKDCVDVVGDKTTEVFIVPKVERALSNLLLY
jgi:hypothetical protein